MKLVSCNWGDFLSTSVPKQTVNTMCKVMLATIDRRPRLLDFLDACDATTLCIKVSTLSIEVLHTWSTVCSVKKGAVTFLYRRPSAPSEPVNPGPKTFSSSISSTGFVNSLRRKICVETSGSQVWITFRVGDTAMNVSAPTT